jgi:HAMP domain-containing protein
MSVDRDLLAELRRVIDELAREEVADLVAEARLEARVRARGILADALAERMLEHARPQLLDGAATLARREDERAEAEHPRPARRGTSAAGEPVRASGSQGASDGPSAAPVESRSPADARTASRTADDDSSADELGWYVYCVSHDGVPPDMLATQELASLTLICEAGLGAVAGRVSLGEFGEEPLRDRLNDLTWLEDTARAHEQVVNSIRELTTVVPMRLCTIYRSEEAVREMLLRERDFLGESLQRLTDRAEWGVKVFARAGQPHDEQEGSTASVGRSAEQAPQAGPGEAYLLGRQREGLRRREAEDRLEEQCAHAHEQLAAGAAEARTNPPQSPELSGREDQMILNGVYLVDAPRTDRFLEIVGALSEEYDGLGLDVELTGPWPPYNFVNPAVEID